MKSEIKVFALGHVVKKPDIDKKDKKEIGHKNKNKAGE